MSINFKNKKRNGIIVYVVCAIILIFFIKGKIEERYAYYKFDKEFNEERMKLKIPLIDSSFISKTSYRDRWEDSTRNGFRSKLFHKKKFIIMKEDDWNSEIDYFQNPNRNFYVELINGYDRKKFKTLDRTAYFVYPVKGLEVKMKDVSYQEALDTLENWR